MGKFFRWPLWLKIGIPRQSGRYTCGAAALATLYAEHLGWPRTEEDFLLLLGGSDAKSMDDLQWVCQRDGLIAVGYEVSVEALETIGRPAILHMYPEKSIGHFVVLRGMDGNRVRLADPEDGDTLLSYDEFERVWVDSHEERAGRALFVAPASEQWLPLRERDLDARIPSKSLEWF